MFNFRKALKNVKILNVHDQGLHLLFPFFFDKRIIWQINDLPIEFLKTKDLSIFNRVKKSYIKASTKLFVKSITVNVSKNRERVLNNLGLNSEVLYCGIEKVDINRNLTASLNRLKSKKINNFCYEEKTLIHKKGNDSAISGYQKFDIVENKNFIKFYFLLGDRKNKIYQKFNRIITNQDFENLKICFSSESSNLALIIIVSFCLKLSIISNSESSC